MTAISVCVMKKIRHFPLPSLPPSLRTFPSQIASARLVTSNKKAKEPHEWLHHKIINIKDDVHTSTARAWKTTQQKEPQLNYFHFNTYRKLKKQSSSRRSEQIIEREDVLLRRCPLCCSVNGQWDNISNSVLFSDDRYGLMLQQLQVLFRMSNYTNAYTVWKPCGRKVRHPQHKHARRRAPRQKRPSERCALVHLVPQSLLATARRRF